MKKEIQRVLTKRGLTTGKFTNKRVLVRCGFDVPLQGKKVTDTTRLLASIPTITYLLKSGASKIVLMSHLGRPKGPEVQFSLKPVAKALEAILNRKVDFAQKLSDVKTSRAKIVLLENLRFDEREKKNDANFAKELASIADVFVNDDFGIAHRSHTSNAAIVSQLPSYVGLLPQTEAESLASVESPSSAQRPLTIVVGFAKISDKIVLLEKLLKKADTVLIGGAVCFTFLAALGYEIGKSRFEIEQVALAKQLLAQYREKIILPCDVVVAKTLDAKKSDTKVVPISKIPKSMAGFDVGPDTVAAFGDVISQSRTVFWNGPMGVFEKRVFANGTNALALCLAKASTNGCISIIGGGDTASSIAKSGVIAQMSHVSTGGGASLAFIEKGTLPMFSVIAKKYS